MPGQRLYHSGDLGVLRPDGCLIFKGRKDFKVKIHGINVETTHIDASLRLHPSVRDAITVADVDESGERYLTVYVVPEEGSSLTTTELRRFLLELLPVHMLSVGLVFLESLPLTPNGKVDHRALPRPTGNRPPIGQSFVAPRDEWERNLARICQTILGIDRIGVEDNFFDLGMDSLKAVQLVTQIEKEFGEEVPPGTLLRSPTVDQLAGVLRQKSVSRSWSSLVPVQPAGSKTPFFWVHGDFSNAFLAQYLGGDQPLYALDHQSQDGSPALHVTVEAIAAEYLREMRSVQGSGPYFLGGYSFGGIVAFEVAHQIQRMGEKVGLLFLLDPPGFTGGRLPESMTPDFRRRGRIRRHLSRLASLKTTERLDYVWSRAVVVTQGVFYSRTYGIRKATKMLLWRIHLRMGKPIPLRLRSPYILDIYNRARLKYVPQVYRGRAVLLRGEQLSSRFHKDWDGLLQGPLERFQLGEVDHVKLREEAYVPLWAQRLKTSLADAQAEGAAVGAFYDRAIFAGE
jgi:aspartate racemase